MANKENQVWGVIETVSPQIIQYTGYDLGLGSLNVEVLSPEEYGKANLRYVYPYLDSVRLTPPQRLWFSYEERVLRSSFGYYDFYREGLIINDKGRSTIPIMEFGNTIVHELVHRGQFYSNPRLGEEWKGYDLATLDGSNDSESVRRRKRALRDSKLMSGFIESEAYAIENEFNFNDVEESYLEKQLQRVATSNEETVFINWYNKNLTRWDKDIILHNPKHIATFYYSTKSPSQLLAESEKRPSFAA